MVFDLILGGELFGHLRRMKKFDLPTARFYCACVASAFTYLHDKKIVYRDLKPENLLLDERGYPLLGTSARPNHGERNQAERETRSLDRGAQLGGTRALPTCRARRVAVAADFGLAKPLPSSGKLWTLCGTPNYMPPEMVSHKGYGFAADWWTLGIFTYELFTSTTPFVDDDPFLVARKILKRDIEWPPLLQKHVTLAHDFVDNLLQVTTRDRRPPIACTLTGPVGPRPR